MLTMFLMAQQPPDTSFDAILQKLDVENVADEQVRQILVILLNRIEQLESKVNTLEAENQQLRDENNRLKGEHGQPNLKPNRPKSSQKNHSSEQERKKLQTHNKSSKNDQIKIDREEILVIPKQQLPSDAQFKGYEDVIVQDINLGTDNVLFRKQKYYSLFRGQDLFSRDAPWLPWAIWSESEGVEHQSVLRWQHD